MWIILLLQDGIKNCKVALLQVVVDGWQLKK